MSKDEGGHGSEAGAGGGAKLDEFVEKTKADLGLDKLHIAHTKAGDLHLSMIAVAKDKQGSGTGTKALNRLSDHADEHGHRMTLTPDKGDGFGHPPTKR